MAQETLAQVFGANVTQDATTLTITKADLASTGLTPSATNSPASLLIAILLFAQNTLNSTNQAANPEIVVTIAQSAYPSIDVRNSTNYLQQNYTVSLETELQSSTVNPNNYA